ncbi:hypothetical protein KBX50_08590 [Micromonospora sp. C51]|uniref:hypothetical protein n=1 Tax=Micromonospora sp. C51 TaxID=2824879 RepID=UPI001B39125E|nr:hypothetical protein [Micromonospora sp. C51]MBQ1048516.1 hypothetical protein [Micromonospora sp. C51]
MSDADTVQSGEPSSEPNSTRRITTRNLAFLTIETAVKIFLSSIDKSRQIISIIDEQHATNRSTALGPYIRRMEVQERIGIEAAVSRLSRSRGDRLKKKMDDLRKERGNEPPKQEPDGKDIYPVAMEQVFATMGEYFTEIENEIWAEIQERYAEKEVHLGFASNYYLSLTQPTLIEHLSESLLTKSIYSLEDCIGALTRCTLTIAGAETLGDLPPVPYKVIESYGKNSETADIQRWAIDRRTEEFVRGGPREWRESIERWCGFDIDLIGGDWPAIREAVARTRLYSRGSSGRVDNQYLAEIDKGAASEIPLWEKLDTDSKYLSYLLDQLELASLCLSLRWAQHFFPDPEVNIDFFLDRIIDFEHKRRWRHGVSLCETLLDTFVHRDHPTFNLISLNLWLCMQETEGDQAARKEVESFAPADSYELIGKSALLRDWPQLVDAIKEFGRAEEGGKIPSWMARMPLMRRSLEEYPPLRSLFPVQRSRSKRRRKRS